MPRQYTVILACLLTSTLAIAKGLDECPSSLVSMDDYDAYTVEARSDGRIGLYGYVADRQHVWILSGIFAKHITSSDSQDVLLTEVDEAHFGYHEKIFGNLTCHYQTSKGSVFDLKKVT